MSSKIISQPQGGKKVISEGEKSHQVGLDQVSFGRASSLHFHLGFDYRRTGVTGKARCLSLPSSFYPSTRLLDPPLLSFSISVHAPSILKYAKPHTSGESLRRTKGEAKGALKGLNTEADNRCNWCARLAQFVIYLTANQEVPWPGGVLPIFG